MNKRQISPIDGDDAACDPSDADAETSTSPEKSLLVKRSETTPLGKMMMMALTVIHFSIHPFSTIRPRETYLWAVKDGNKAVLV